MFCSLGLPVCHYCILGPCHFSPRYWQTVPLKLRKWVRPSKPKKKEPFPQTFALWALGSLGNTADLWTNFGVILLFFWRLIYVHSLVALLASPVAFQKFDTSPSFCPISVPVGRNWQHFCWNIILKKLFDLNAVHSVPSHQPRRSSTDLLWITTSLKQPLLKWMMDAWVTWIILLASGCPVYRRYILFSFFANG